MQGKNPGHGFYIRLRIQSGKWGIASENHDFEKSFITESWSDTVEIRFWEFHSFLSFWKSVLEFHLNSRADLVFHADIVLTKLKLENDGSDDSAEEIPEELDYVD